MNVATIKHKYVFSIKPLWLSLLVGLAHCHHGYPHGLQPLAGLAKPFTQDGSTNWLAPNLPILLQQWVRQQTPSACSVATVTTVLNSALVARHKRPILQDQVVRSDSTDTWRQSTLHASSPGVGLDLLGLLTLHAFYAANLHRVQVDVVHGQANVADKARILKLLQRTLEKGQDGFVLVNFQQNLFTALGDPEGHMAVVAGLNLKTKQLLILDVDPKIKDPYWITSEQFFNGILSRDLTTHETRGLLLISLQ